MPDEKQVTPDDALRRLLEGNARYVSGEMTHPNRIGPERRRELSGGQSPFASVLGCADSRVPPEHLFDAALGELFVCRNAGNVLTDAALGSFEYAAAHTTCPLLIVLGHSDCGALTAAVAAAETPTDSESPCIDDLMRRLLPAVLATGGSGDGDPAARVNAAAAQNVHLVCEQALQRSSILSNLVESARFRVVGAWYDLGTGRVSIIRQ
ncbi:MAG: carbonic anhydrase [Polyangia bacterium]